MQAVESLQICTSPLDLDENVQKSYAWRVMESLKKN